MRNLFVVLFILFSVTISAAADSILIKEFDFAAVKDNTKVADDYLAEKTTGNPTFKERKKIIPVYFTVTFQEEAKTLVKGHGLVGALSGGEAKDSVWIAKLKGLTPELRQKITDDIFTDFVTDLTGRGFNVVTPDQLAGNESFQEMMKSTTSNLKGADQVKTTKDDNVFWQVAPKGMLLPESGIMAQMALMKNVSKLMVDAGKASAVIVSIVIDVVKLTGVGSSDGSRSANNDTVFGMAIPTGTVEGKLGFSLQMIPYNAEYEKYGEKHVSVYNSQGSNGLNYNLAKAVETAATPIGEGKFVKDNKMAGALALGLTLLGKSTMATPRIEYDVTVDPNKYEETARMLAGAVRNMALEKAKQKYF